MIERDNVMSLIPTPTGIDEGKFERNAEYRVEVFNNFKLMTKTGIIGAAWALKKMESFGDCIPDGASLVYIAALRRVGEGVILPELFMSFCFDKPLLARVGTYSLEDQRKVVDGKDVEVVEFDNKGDVAVRKLLPFNLQRTQIDQVYGPDGPRNKDQQIAYVAGLRNRRHIARAPAIKNGVKVEKGKGIWVNEQFLSKKQLAEFLVAVEA